MIATIKIKDFLLRNTLLKNFSVLTISTAISQFLGLFISIKIARALDPTLFGTYNLLNIQASIFTVIASFGLRNVIIRDVARNKNSVNSVFVISVMLRGLGVLLACLIFTGYYFLYKGYDYFLFFLVLLSIVSGIFYDLLESVAFGLEKMEFSGIINLVSTALWLLSIMVIPLQELTLHLVFGLYVFFLLLKTFIYYFSIGRQVHVQKIKYRKIGKSQITQFFKDSFPYYYLALFTLLSNQVPILFLQFRSGIEQIGFFNIANKVLIPINLVVSTALAASFPNLARLFRNNFESFIKNSKMIFILLTLFGVMGASGITLFRTEIVKLLYGEKYISASLVLVYQVWHVAIYGIICLMGTILSAIDKQKVLGILSIVCTVIELPILWVSSKGGAQSLSSAFLISSIIIFIIHFFVVKKFLGNKLSILFLGKVISIFVIGFLISLSISTYLKFTGKALSASILLFASGFFLYIKYKSRVQRLFTR